MKNRTQEKTFPLTYSGWDEGCGEYGDIQFYDVEFTDDFGPIKKGDRFNSVFIGHNDGVLACYAEVGEKDEDGCTPTQEVHKVNFKVVPV